MVTQRNQIKGINVDDTLEKQGPGAYGVIALGRGRVDETGSLRRTGGHELFYKVDNNGKVRYYDGQNAKVDDNWMMANARCAGNMNIEAVSYRLDNATPNLRAMEIDGVITTPGRINNGILNVDDKRLVYKYGKG